MCRSSEVRWLGRQDSNLGSRDQNPLPYHLATPHRNGTHSVEPVSAYAGLRRKSRKRPITARIETTPIAIHLKIVSAIGTQRTSSCDAAKTQLAWRKKSDRLERPPVHPMPTARAAGANDARAAAAPAGPPDADGDRREHDRLPPMEHVQEVQQPFDRRDPE